MQAIYCHQSMLNYGLKLSQVCTGLVELFMTRPFHDTQEHMCVPWRRVAGPWR